MCFSKSEAATTTTQSSSLPAWAQNASQKNYNTAVDISNRPRPQFQGPRIADFNADQNAAFSATRNNVGAFQPNMNQATQSATQGSMAVPDMDLQKYMNPYQQNVVDTTMNELNRQGGIQNAAVDRQIAGRKAFGSSGDLLKSEVYRNQDAVKANTMSNLMQQGYDRATGLATSDAQRKLQGAQTFAGLGSLQSQLGYQDAGALGTVGDRQQGQTQANYDMAVSDFEREFNYPTQNLNLLMSSLANSPLPRDQTQTTVGPGGSPAGQALGGAAALVGMGGKNGLGWWGAGSTGGPFGAW